MLIGGHSRELVVTIENFLYHAVSYAKRQYNMSRPTPHQAGWKPKLTLRYIPVVQEPVELEPFCRRKKDSVLHIGTRTDPIRSMVIKRDRMSLEAIIKQIIRKLLRHPKFGLWSMYHSSGRTLILIAKDIHWQEHDSCHFLHAKPVTLVVEDSHRIRLGWRD
jgi:hypothetical protein